MKKHLIMLVAIATIAPLGHAKWARVTEAVPVARLTENLARYVAENPKDADGHYTLGRIHSLAFARGTEKIDVIPVGSAYLGDNKKLPGFAGYDSIKVQRSDAAAPPSDEALSHLKNSVANYAQAVNLAPKNALFQLGLGWMLEQGAPFAAKLGAAWDDPRKKQAEAKPGDWQAKSLTAYRAAFALAKEADAKGFGRGPVSDSAISLEAGEGIIRLLTAPTAAEKTELETIRAHSAVINAKPRAVTPIVIPLGRETSLTSLLATNNSVTFDLAGDGLGKRWPWVNASAGILGWDPQRTGKITSGRQLFGSVTWWIFWKDGYAALASLDNNHDGWLARKELAGIAIWRDANGNGVSEPGEVRPLAEWNITALAVRGVEQGGVLGNLQGVRLKNGRTLPSYDWMPRSVD